MSSHALAASTPQAWICRIDDIARLIGWVRPSADGRRQALATLEELRSLVADAERFAMKLGQLARDLDEVYPGGAIVSLARRYVRDMLRAFDHRR